MIKTYTGRIEVSVDIDTSFWDEEELKNWSDVFSEVGSHRELAEDILQRYVDGDLDLPKGVVLKVDDTYIKPGIIKIVNEKVYAVHPKKEKKVVK